MCFCCGSAALHAQDRAKSLQQEAVNTAKTCTIALIGGDATEIAGATWLHALLVMSPLLVLPALLWGLRLHWRGDTWTVSRRFWRRWFSFSLTISSAHWLVYLSVSRHANGGSISIALL